MTQDKWQKIETAPKDGKYVLIYDPRSDEGTTMVAYWDDTYAGWVWGTGYYDITDSATHWMNLPKIPGEQS